MKHLLILLILGFNLACEEGNKSSALLTTPQIDQIEEKEKLFEIPEDLKKENRLWKVTKIGRESKIDNKNYYKEVINFKDHSNESMHFHMSFSDDTQTVYKNMNYDRIFYQDFKIDLKDLSVAHNNSDTAFKDYNTGNIAIFNNNYCDSKPIIRDMYFYTFNEDYSETSTNDDYTGIDDQFDDCFGTNVEKHYIGHILTVYPYQLSNFQNTKVFIKFKKINNTTYEVYHYSSLMIPNPYPDHPNYPEKLEETYTNFFTIEFDGYLTSKNELKN